MESSVSEESLHNLGPERQLRDAEAEMLARLIARAGEAGKLCRAVTDLKVREMPDGGMGSLYFVSHAKAPEQRRSGRRTAELQLDYGGVPVLVSLNVDQDGDLFEMDVWKADLTPVTRLGGRTQDLSTG
jgi:hypothetical protein